MIGKSEETFSTLRNTMEIVFGFEFIKVSKALFPKKLGGSE